MLTGKHRVLVIAEAANPEWASMPLGGWALSRALARVVNAHLVTHIRNRDAVLRAGLVEGRDFTAIDNERVAAPLWRISNKLRGGGEHGWTTFAAFSSVAYYAFEHELWRQFASRISQHEFDFVHRITPVSQTHQSLIASRAAKSGVPFVIGPINGGVPWPKHFRDRQRAEKEWLLHLREVYKFMPAYRSTRKYSAAIIVGSKHAYAEIPHWAKEKCIYIPQNGVDPQRFTQARAHSASLPLKAAFVGRLVPLKGVDMFLEAAAGFIRDGRLELRIIGDGPHRPELEAIVDRLRIRAGVRFCGWVPHKRLQEELRMCDFLAFPSVREYGGAVVLESMALGVPPIVADYAGPSELVDEETGIRVKFHDQQSLVNGFRDAIGHVIESPELLDRLGFAGRRKAIDHFSWDAKARQIVHVYDSIRAGKLCNSLDFMERQK